MKIMRLLIVFPGILLAILLLAACGNQVEIPDNEPHEAELEVISEAIPKAENGVIEKVVMQSSALGKEMVSMVCLPPGYDPSIQYPVLYFLPGYGIESAEAMIYSYDIAKTADRLIRENQIYPMIIVALGADNSFGLNSAAESNVVWIDGEKHHEGMYEDYIIHEAIPYVDEHFSTDPTRNGRYIGGYSMGGYAAMHLAFSHPDMFAKVGGHSPTVIDSEWLDLPEPSGLVKWLYPDKEAYYERDPIQLAKANDLSGLSVCVDGEAFDEEMIAEILEETGMVLGHIVEMLYEVLSDEGIEVEFHLYPGQHSNIQCKKNMEKYLIFYGTERGK
jgi:enterochelin esterase-like enzyme